MSHACPYRAVIFDLGGVVFPSPFEAFDAYDRAAGLAPGTVRALIRTSSERGAWAALERGALTMAEFCDALETEAAASGFALDAARLMAMVGAGFGPRPEMVRAVDRIRAEGLRVGALTNNWASLDVAVDDTRDGDGTSAAALPVFDAVVESSVEGVRKPDVRIYELALARLGVTAPQSVYLDDLGMNLKPARVLGMTTIKVSDPGAALAQLSDVLGFEVR